MPMSGKIRYLVLALSAGNICMVGESRNPDDTVEAVINRAVTHATPPADLNATAGDALKAPTCPLHSLPMTLMHDRKGKPFWSCHERATDGRWCTYKPGGAITPTSVPPTGSTEMSASSEESDPNV